MGWNIHWTLWIIGIVVITYTTVGGVKGVNWNDFQQFIVIGAGMAAACIVTIRMLPPEVSFLDAVSLTGAMGKMKAVDYSFDWQNRYNFWSGLIGGAFLALSYFGTDQSQVQRYLTGSSIAQSRLGLLFNGLAKVPMQFCILFVGVMVFAFYQFVPPPLFFNPEEVRKINASPYAAQYRDLETRYSLVASDQEQRARSWLASRGTAGEGDARKRMLEAKDRMDAMRHQATDLMHANDADANPSDTNYVFLSFVLQHLPAGLVGLVVVVILAATMSSSASALNSLATTTVIDVYRRLVRTDAQDRHYLQVTRGSTIFWGAFAVLLSERVSRLGSLVEAVNILGSLFYGTVLGIFMLAFFFKHVRGTSTFLAAIAGEAVVIYLFLFTKISFLWYNVFGCLAVIAAAFILQPLLRGLKPANSDAG
jgi:Na+/proline symporter